MTNISFTLCKEASPETSQGAILLVIMVTELVLQCTNDVDSNPKEQNATNK
jgi:hypothetical protein